MALSRTTYKSTSASLAKLTWSTDRKPMRSADTVSKKDAM